MGAYAAPSKGNKASDDFSSVDVAGLISIPGGKAASDWSAERIRGVMIVVVLAEGADLRCVCTAVEGMFAAVAD